MKASILKKDFYRRICIYLKEMFPPRNMGFGLLFFMSAWCGIVLLDHSRNDILLPPGHIFLSGAFTISLMLLLLRIMDELKDLETDLLHFPKRPIPRGAVHSSDLKSFGLFIVGVLFILNMFFTHATFIFFIVFGYACLMFKYFFLKELISKNIMIALATHNPISYLFFFYVFFVYKNNMTASIQMKPVILLGTVFFCISMSWEIARKIRYPEDETTYQTYSKVLGLGAAILILMIPISISLFVIIYLYHNIFSRFTLYYVIVVYLFVMTTFLRFYKKQKIMFGLKTTMEIFIVNVQSILVFEGIVAICR
ncbi:MAG: UbiA family prenyltransferase [Desulfobacterales bacterium]